MTSRALDHHLSRLAHAVEGLSRRIAQLDPTSLTVAQWQEAAASLGTQITEMNSAANEISNAFGLTSTQARLLLYLKAHVGEVVTNHQLRGVAGIHDWPRRVRELRELGWPVSTNTNRADLEPGEYVLEAAQPRNKT
jgi:hypothetical protein